MGHGEILGSACVLNYKLNMDLTKFLGDKTLPPICLKSSMPWLKQLTKSVLLA